MNLPVSYRFSSVNAIAGHKAFSLADALRLATITLLAASTVSSVPAQQPESEDSRPRLDAALQKAASYRAPPTSGL
jgi:hypothetical protein